VFFVSKIRPMYINFNNDVLAVNSISSLKSEQLNLIIFNNNLDIGILSYIFNPRKRIGIGIYSNIMN